MSKQKTIYYSILFTIFLHPSTFNLNLAKLKVEKFQIINKTNQDQLVKITSSKWCMGCKRTRKIQETYELMPREEKWIRNINATLKNISFSKESQAIEFQKKKSYPDIIITNKKRTHFPFHVKFEDLFKNFFPNHFIQQRNKFMGRLRGLQFVTQDGISSEDFLNFVQKLYEKNNLEKQKKLMAQTPKIPLIIHQIWFGIDLPSTYKKKQKIWKQKHVNWKIICWSEELLKKHFPQGLVNQQAFDKAKKIKHYARMSDIARYEIVNKFGGLYVDCDFDCFENFEPLHQIYDFFVGMEELHSSCSGCANGIFGAKQRHPILKKCIKNIKNYSSKQFTFEYCKNKYQQEAEFTWICTGPGLITKSIWHAADKDGNIDIIFPHPYLLPTNNIDHSGTPASFCYHNYNFLVKHPERHWTFQLKKRLKNQENEDK